MLKIHLIGKPRLERDGEQIVGPRGHKTWALLARLVRSSEPVSRQRLVDELFDGADDPMGALRWALAELRRTTGLTGAFQGNPVVLGLDADTRIDVVDVAAGEIDAAIPEGEFLEGINVRAAPGFESWLLVERQRVDSEIISALRQSTLRALAGRSHERAIDLAGAMVRRAPFDEGPHVLLVKALAASGDAEAAARQVEASESMFVEEMGVRPTDAIRNAARPNVAASVPGVSARASAISLLEAGLAAVSAGAVDAGVECLRRASADAEDSGDAELLSRCLVELGTALVHSIRGYDDEGAVVLQASIESANAAGAQLTAAKAMSELGYVDLLAGRRSSATRYLDGAEELGASDPTLLAAVASFKAMNISDWGRIDEAAGLFREALDMARSSGATRREIWTLGLGARTFFSLGEFDHATEWAERSRRLATEVGWTAFRPWPEVWLYHVRLAGGDDPAAVRYDAEATFALARQLQDPCWEGIAAKVIGLTYVAEEEHQHGLEWMANAKAWCGRVTDTYKWVQTEIFLAEARAALEAGDGERAESVARDAIAEAARGQMDGLLGQAMQVLSAVRSD